MGKPHKERKAEIIQGALTLAAELGVKKVTTQAIADHVGIAQATVFRHFKTRDEIFSGAIGWLATSMFEALSGCFSSSEPADVKLRLLVVRHLICE